MRRYYVPTKLSENIRKTPEGYLLCLDVPIARTGEMEYHERETPLEGDDNGIVTISRDEDEVFSPKTIASFEGKPITIRHPSQFVDPKNWSSLSKGVIQNVRRGKGDQANDLMCDMLIMSGDAISLVENGFRGLSCGYEAEYEQTGTGRGRQSNIVGNHLALVDEGRAGDAYQINDSKGASMKKSFADKIKAIFTDAAKAIDEAAAEADPKDAPAKDEGVKGLDELVKMIGDLAAKVDGMKAPAAKDEPDPKAAKKDDPPAAKDEEVAPGIEDRLKKLEESVTMLLEKLSAKAGSEDADGDDLVTDEDEDDEETEDEDIVETGDELSRAEILSPGIQKTKDLKVKALKAAYATADGKRVIHGLTAGKAPAFDKAETVDHLFVAVSEILKVTRGGELAAARRKAAQVGDSVSTPMTAEMMNEKNAKFYNQR